MKLKTPKSKYGNALLIDDNELDNFINQKILEANNFAEKIYVNTSARGAIEFLTNLVVMGKELENLHPFVLFIDINMPLMDGFQFIEYFKKNLDGKLRKSKLVILTSSVSYEDVLKAMDISPEIIFLNKPLTKEMLDKI